MAETRKFWCHYIGTDDKPKRRSMELELVNIPNSDVALWCEKEQDSGYGDETYYYYYPYCIVGENVAFGTRHFISSNDMELFAKTESDWRSWAEEHFCDGEDWWIEESIAKYIEDNRKERECRLNQLRSLVHCVDFMIESAPNCWIQMSAIKACEEVNHPRLEELRLAREKCVKYREEQDRLERMKREEERKAEEERKRKELAEGEARLAEQEKVFRDGGMIAGEDVVTLCRKYGIKMHLRTVHNLQQVISTIDGKGYCRYCQQTGKRKPVLDGCFKVSTELYDFLNKQQ
ncbi:hypothetical protein E5358_12670 [Palleniella muris]|uniref:Uncharacterized protein n=1 Tax=Palleniella muris TaxID=3038145 RepID=A0AC61QMJ2_9BACT|nr:hypothetical protein [Palleniella muris]TGX80504.1 hypothetical protein E5358_12670 [Palleniella muris]